MTGIPSSRRKKEISFFPLSTIMALFRNQFCVLELKGGAQNATLCHYHINTAQSCNVKFTLWSIYSLDLQLFMVQFALHMFLLLIFRALSPN